MSPERYGARRWALGAAVLGVIPAAVLVVVLSGCGPRPIEALKVTSVDPLAAAQGADLQRNLHLGRLGLHPRGAVSGAR